MVRPMRRTLVLFALVGFALTGCKGNCRQLSEKLCQCELNTYAKDACLQRVSSEEARVGTTPQDEEVCGQLLDSCDCHTIDTPEGKKACGLAR